MTREIFDRVDGKIPDPEPPAPEINMEAIAKRNAERIAKRKRNGDKADASG